MANIIGKSAGKVFNKYHEALSGDTVSSTVSGPLNKLWRAKILLDRQVRPVIQGTSKRSQKDNRPKRNSSEYSTQPSEGTNNTFVADKKSFSTNINEAIRTLNNDKRRSLQRMWVLGDSAPLVTSPDRDLTKADTRRELGRKLRADNAIQIINFSANPIQYIQLQTIPSEIQHVDETAWAVINSMGRNVPMYHYTGSETSVTFSVSWYSDDRDNPDDVLTKCRLLEAWTKADGYVKAPPILQIRWGSADVFKDQFFILAKADYRLSNWRVASNRYDPQTKRFIPVGKQPGLQPSTATQELTFKRVSLTNLRYSDIISPELLKITKGIKYE